MNEKLPRVNAYVCEYGCILVTIDVDDGVTPFMIKCRKKPTKQRPLLPPLMDKHGECKGMARSSFYPKAPIPKNYPPITHEWRKPSQDDVFLIAERYGISLEEAHNEVKNNPNQLWLFDRTDREPKYHEESNQ
jgi:hypothetical protein